MVMSKNLENKFASDRVSNDFLEAKEAFLENMDIDPQFKDQLADMFKKINASVDEIVDPKVQEAIQKENLKLVSFDAKGYSRRYKSITQAASDDDFSQAA